MLMHPAQALMAQNGGARRAALGFAPRPMPALSDPSRVAPTVSPKDLRDVPDKETPPTTDGAKNISVEQGREMLSLLERCYKAGQARKAVRAWQVYEGRAAFAGEFWCRWDTRAARFLDMRSPGWRGSGRRYESRNFILGKVLENIARVTRNDPDIGASPLSASQKDVMGTHEARVVLDHFDRDWNSEAQIRAAIQEGDVAGTPLWKVEFDPSASDDIPRLNPDGSVADVFEMPNAGKVRCDLVRWEEWLTDHVGDMFDEAGRVKVPWLIHCRPTRLSDIQAYYKNGFAVEAEPSVFGDSSVWSLLASTSGDYRMGSGLGEKEWANLKQMYVLPTPKLKKDGFPDGLVLTAANGVLLDARNMEDGFPFIPVYHLKVQGDIDGQNYVSRILPAQIGYNRMLSKAAEHADLPEYHILASGVTSFSPNAYKGTDARIVNYTGGAPPAYQVKPPLSNVVTELLGMEQGNIDRTSNVTPMGDMGAQDASAAAIQMRMEGDLSQTKDQISNLHASLLKRAERLLKLVGKYYGTSPRLWLMGGGDDPNEAQARAMALQALTTGARVRLKLAADSATPRTPAMHLQFVQQIMQPGNLSPDTLPALIAMLKAVDLYGTDEIAEGLEAALEGIQQQQQANAPNPAAIEAQKHTQQAEQMALQSHIDQEHAAITLHTQTALKRLDAELQLALKRMPSVGLAGKLDPAATVSAEDELGLKTDIATARQMATTPKPQAGGGQQKQGQ